MTNPVEPAGRGFFSVQVRVPFELLTDATNPPAAELLTNAGPAGNGSVIVAPVQLSNVDAQRNRIEYVKLAPAAGVVVDTRLSMTRLGAADAAGTPIVRIAANETASTTVTATSLAWASPMRLPAPPPTYPLIAPMRVRPSIIQPTTNTCGLK